ncbi:MAG: hypothetical protein KF713_01335 [Turneriella sp.]|nr:hypothetical protein [Turneriella sp.]
MKIAFWYAGGGALVTGTVLALLTTAGSPESLLLGHWKELAWEYEQDEQTPLVHRAEGWHFLPGQQLLLQRKGSIEKVRWRLAGRSNVLLLRYASGVTEHYNVTELRADKLVLNFETDIQARGVAKLTFTRLRVDRDAQGL